MRSKVKKRSVKVNLMILGARDKTLHKEHLSKMGEL